MSRHRQRQAISPYDIVRNQHTESAKDQTPAVGDQAFIRSVHTGTSNDSPRAFTVTRVSPTGRVVTVTAADDPTMVVKLTRRFDGTFRWSSTAYVAFAAA